MNIDVRTMYIANAATCFIVAAALSAFDIGRLRRDGALLWALGWAFQGTCWVLFGLRGIVWDFFSIVIANSLLTASYPLFYAAVRQFQGRTYSRVWLLLPPVVTFLFFLYFAVYTDNLPYRVMFIAVVAVLQTGALAWMLFHHGPIPERRAYRLTGSAFLIFFLIWLGLLAEGLTLQRGQLSVLVITPFRVAALLAGSGIAILSSLGFVLMIRARAEQGLRDSEERSRTLADAAFEGIAITESGRILDANKPLLKIMGGTRDELIGQNVAAFVAPEDRERVMTSITGSLESHLEHRMFRRDGTPRVVETHGRTIPYQGWHVRITAIRDITEQKRAEELLQEYEKAVEGSADMIATVDREYRYRLANASFLTYRGKSKEEVIGRLAKEILGKDVFEKIVKGNLDRCFRGEFVHYEMKHAYPELGERHLLVSYFPVRGSEGVDRVTTVIQDITEQKQAEEALKKAHDELEQRVVERTAELREQAELLNLTHDAIIARDLNHRIFFWNKGAEELYGWTREEVEGKVTRDLLQTKLPELRQTIDEKLLLHGRWEGEVTHTTRDGRKVIVASRQALRRGNDGKPIAILTINSDITEQKRIDEERQRLAAER